MRTRLLALTGAALALILLAGCSSSTSPGDTDKTPATSSSSAAADLSGCQYPTSGTAAKQVTPPPATPTVSGTVNAVMHTSAGDIPLTLDATKTKCTTNSFVSLAAQKYFDNTICHRLTTSGIYVLQCGDPTGTGAGGPGYSFKDELSGTETYPAGTLAMANAGADTNGSQFFLVYKDSSLPPQYTVFGKMDAAGLAVVQAIAAKGIAAGSSTPGDGAPATPVTITGITIG